MVRVRIASVFMLCALLVTGAQAAAPGSSVTPLASIHTGTLLADDESDANDEIGDDEAGGDEAGASGSTASQRTSFAERSGIEPRSVLIGVALGAAGSLFAASRLRRLRGAVQARLGRGPSAGT